MGAKETTHNRQTKLMIMENVDPHHSMCRQHGCVEHQVKTPMLGGKLNIDDHTPHCPPLKITWK